MGIVNQLASEIKTLVKRMYPHDITHPAPYSDVEQLAALANAAAGLLVKLQAAEDARA